MTENTLRVRNCVFATVQDLGRYGYRALGVPVSGAMDRTSAVQANVLVGNSPNTPLIESFGPIDLEAGDNTIVAVTGAQAEVYVDDYEVETYRPLWLNRGSVLRVVSPVRGAVVYIAVAGGVEAELVLGSYSTYIRAGFGGYGGRALKPGDRLRMRRGVDLEGLWSRVSLLEIPEENRVVSRLGDPVELRMTVGHHTHLLSEADRSRLVDSLYTVSQESDRMGFRLEGPPLESLRGLGRVPSFAVDRGFVQVPPEGRPIILMADSQTTGGYAVVGVVLPPDVDLLAQCVPGTRVRLRFINISTAEEVVRSYLSYLEKPRTEEVSEGFSEYDLHT